MCVRDRPAPTAVRRDRQTIGRDPSADRGSRSRVNVSLGQLQRAALSAAAHTHRAAMLPSGSIEAEDPTGRPMGLPRHHGRLVYPAAQFARCWWHEVCETSRVRIRSGLSPLRRTAASFEVRVRVGRALRARVW